MTEIIMSLIAYSAQFFNIASVFYAIAFLFYAGQLVSTKKIFTQGPSWIVRTGWAFHTLALVTRWIEAGIGHPPWTNLYESLVFFSWGVMTIHLFLEFKMEFKVSGIFASALVFAAMGVASLHPHKEIEPLVPALQSWWLLFHVFMACIAYAFFLSSSFIAVFYLAKDRVPVEKLAGFAALVCTIFISIAYGKFVLQVPVSAVPLGVFKILVVSSLGLYLAAAGALFYFPKKKLSKALFFSALIVQIAAILVVILCRKGVPVIAIRPNPYRFAALCMTGAIAIFFSAFLVFRNRILELLPKTDNLDRWCYQTILLGFPFMTLNLISGAVWAYYAWGRYWGWDPKETWALITWFIYAIYLHARILGGWKGRPAAVISVLGFFVVIFTYLGVNLVISGLHSYATS